MLKINLLPENKRRAEATPIVRMITILAGLVVGLGLCVLLAFQILVLRSQLDDDLKRLVTEKTELAKHAEMADAKNKEIEAMETRKKAIDDLVGSRKRLWYDIMHKLSNVMERNSTAWLETLSGAYIEAKTGPLGAGPGKIQKEYELKGTYAVSGNDKIPALSFRESLQAALVNTGILPGWDDNINITTKEMKEYKEGWQTNGNFTCWRERPAAPPPAKPAPKPAPPK